MISAPLPKNEEKRIAKLYELNILDTIEEPAFDDLTLLASKICDVPIAMISFVDKQRQFLKSKLGLEVNEVSRELGLCPHAILTPDVTVIEDASIDERFSDNPLVTGPPGVRFYAGAPLVFDRDLILGTLCIVDNKARKLSPDQEVALQALARQVVSQLELRVAVAGLKKSKNLEKIRGQIMEHLAKGNSLESTLNLIVSSFEMASPDSICSILLLDETGRHLRHGAAPKLPDFYKKAIDNLEIGPTVGSCGAAAHSKQRVIVENIHTHPNWAPYVSLAEKAGLASCWSEPILNSSGKALGTFAIYHRTAHSPAKSDISLMQYAQHMAAIAIQFKQKERALIHTTKEAEKANIAKSEFLSCMSHELRTPLNAILGFSELIKYRGSDLDKDQLSLYVNEILKAGRHLLGLINDVLDLSRIDTGHLKLELQTVDLDELLTECVNQVDTAIALPHDIHLTIASGTNELKVHADPLRLRQVFYNLLSNSIKYNRSQGTVRLHSELTDNGMVRTYVTDTGVGIARRDLPHLFEPFERLGYKNGSIEGSGVGLTVTKRLIEAMHGQIGVESCVGKGSTFWVELPLMRSSPPDLGKQADEQQTVKSTLSKPVVLLVEDNPANTMLVLNALKFQLNCTVHCCDKGSDAIELAKRYRPDLLLLDIGLPDIDGCELLKTIRKLPNFKETPAIALSAYAMKDDIARAIACGFNRYLTKPFELSQLFHEIEQLFPV